MHAKSTGEATEESKMDVHSARSGKVRVGIVGVGNCASSFVQGLSYYRKARTNEPVPGLMNVDLGGYHVGDVEVSAAFDVSAAKVGCDIAEAIGAAPNNTFRFADVKRTGVEVRRGPTLDGIGRYLVDDITESDAAQADVTDVLTQSRTDVLVSYLPVGSQRATEYYAERALEAGCAFVNCIPVFIASNAKWRKRFEQARLPIIGDDIKSQVGATIVHRVLATLFRERGVRLDRTFQLNFGGNSDFKNMLERERLVSKKISKTQSVTSQFEVPLAADDIHVGPSDHVPWLTDRKWAYIRLEGTTFGGVPLSAELKLEVWDSPNSAGVVIDAVRCARLAMDRRLGGALIGPSSYFMKSPPRQFSDGEARNRTAEFIKGDGRRDGGH
jgi:myo-inositol-1-phosphate synthase